MVKKHAEIEGIVRLLHRNNKALLEFVKDRKVESFDAGVDRVFGDSAARPNLVDINGFSIIGSVRKKHVVSFIPRSWEDRFSKHGSRWAGCERWWAGLPLAVWIEFRMAAASKSGYLRLVAEVGPLHDLEFRERLIENIEDQARAAGLIRVRFPQGALQSRYSRFLHKNSVEIIDVGSADMIEAMIKKVIGDFVPELDAVARAVIRSVHG
ncbi:hypothetical protein ABUK73_21110 [Agrobacterium sp. BA1120]|uniref:hypothetical protein n=1 Tax=Agrobacterium sp. BA1120 TaxID=3228927 RepID=UPI00336A7915